MQTNCLIENCYFSGPDSTTVLGSKLHRQTVGIPMGTNCAPLVADLFLLCYERDFMITSLQLLKLSFLLLGIWMTY